MMHGEKIKQTERYFFYFIVLLNLFPIVSNKFCTSMDGGAHLYNSNLINNLFFNRSEIISRYFMFNPEPVPNWTGHFILSIFNLFLPAFLAEKIFLLFYAIALPVSFRNLLKNISPRNYFLSYLIFPLTYSLLFFLGFYNFFIAFVFMFIGLNYFIKKQGKLSSFKTLLVLFLLISITYFSHIMVFAVLLLLMALYVTVNGFVEWINERANFMAVVKDALQKAGWLLIASLLPLILFYSYFHSRQPTGEIYYLNKIDLLTYIKDYGALVTFDTEHEHVFTRPLFYVVAFLFAAAVYNRIKFIIIERSKVIELDSRFVLRNIITVADFALLSSLVLMVLYLTVADSDGVAGFVSVRFCILFLMMLSLWLAAQHYNKWLQAAAVAVILSCNFGLIYLRTGSVNEYNKIAVSINDASQFINANSVVLPLKYSDNWLCGHFSNYLGIDKPMVILENYECPLGWFPLKWNEKKLPHTLLANTEKKQYPCLRWNSNETNAVAPIDYVFVLGDVNSKTDSCHLEVKQLLDKSFTLKYSTEYCMLFERMK